MNKILLESCFSYLKKIESCSLLSVYQTTWQHDNITLKYDNMIIKYAFSSLYFLSWSKFDYIFKIDWDEIHEIKLINKSRLLLTVFLTVLALSSLHVLGRSKMYRYFLREGPSFFSSAARTLSLSRSFSPYTERKKGITCNESESSKRVTDLSRGIIALH